MESMKDLMRKRNKSLVANYAKNLDSRLRKGFRALGMNKHQIRISRQIFWSICVSQPIARWTHEMQVALFFEWQNRKRADADRLIAAFKAAELGTVVVIGEDLVSSL